VENVRFKHIKFLKCTFKIKKKAKQCLRDQIIVHAVVVLHKINLRHGL